MKISKAIFYRIFEDNDEIVIPVSKGQRKELIDFCTYYNDTFGKDYDIVIKPHQKAKSSDQVKYFWTKLDALSKKLKLPTQEVYQQLIRECGVFNIVPIREDAIENWFGIWKENGNKNGTYSRGWFCEDLGECKNTKGYHNIKCYHGISVYSQEELSRVITELERELEH